MPNRLRARARQHFQPAAALNVWQWAEANIVLSARITPHPGPYRTNWCPYVREPQEAFTDPETETIVWCWASRTSKTESILNCVRYTIACDPQPVLFVMPTGELAESFSETRLRPSIEDSPVLAKEIPENLDNFRKTEMHMKRCTLWLVGANSPALLKGRGVAILVGDEVDTWRGATDKESGALQLAMDRTKDRWNRKHLLTSTPTVDSGQIWREFKKGDCRYYFVPCPHCGHMQHLRLKQIQWAKEAKLPDGTWDLKLVRESAYYECENEACKGTIEDVHKPMMLAKGKWRRRTRTGSRSAGATT